jgi:hypothetical protein
VGEFQAWFGTDADCVDYLEWVRWPRVRVPGVRPEQELAAGGRPHHVRRRGCRTSVTAGTVSDRTRTPLTVWFTACWLFATAKDGISALSLQRSLEISSYQTAWAMLGRLRSVLVRPGRDLLADTVEVDETYTGGEEPGLRGGRARGKKVLTGIAVEVRQPKGIGRCRMALLADASAASLHPFVTGHVEPGATVITDAVATTRASCCPRCTGSPRWPGVAAEHPPGPGRGSAPAELPGRVRVPLQPPPPGQPRPGVLPAAGARCRPRSGALPQHRRRQAATEDPADPPAARGHPPSLERPPAERPWRAADLDYSGYM